MSAKYDRALLAKLCDDLIVVAKRIRELTKDCDYDVICDFIGRCEAVRDWFGENVG